MFPSEAKILIVDDSNFARNALKSSLRELQYWKIAEAAEAKNAKALLYESEADPVHLLIADIHMPDMSGLQLLEWVRGQEKTKDLPVIMLTSSQEKSEILAAGKLGISHYIIKPFDTAGLKEKITSTWQKHGQKYWESVRRRTAG